MNCVVCGYVSLLVLETRKHEQSIFRRRKCPKCGEVHFTEEKQIEAFPEVVAHAGLKRLNESKRKA